MDFGRNAQEPNNYGTGHGSHGFKYIRLFLSVNSFNSVGNDLKHLPQISYPDIRIIPFVGDSFLFRRTTSKFIRKSYLRYARLPIT